MIYGSVCSGIEAASVAWHPLGWRAAFLSEIEPFPRAVLKHHWRDTPLRGDFRDINSGDHEAIDVLVGGTPCQSFSIAGLRRGMADERGNLALEYLRLADRLRPRWILWENVPGALSSSGGRDFGAFLGGLAKLGYGFAYRVLDAQYFRVAQRRERVFVIGYFGDWRRAAAVLFEPASLRRDSPPRRETGAGASVGTLGGTSPGGGWRLGADEAAAGQLVPDTATALRARDGAKGVDSDCTDTLVAFGGGNTRGSLEVSTAIRAKSGWHGDFDSETFIAHTLRGDGFDASEDGTGRGTPPVPVAYRTSPNCGAWSTGDRTDALTSGTDPTSHVLTVPVAFDARQITSSTNRSNPKPGDPCHTIAASDRAPAIIGSWQQSSMDGKGTVGYDPDTQVLRPVKPQSDHQMLHLPFGVRRLTPRECERLQGFPDDYTLIPWRSGRAKDGPRYKAIGNSMAVPVMRWLGARIAAQDADPSCPP